MNPSPEPRLARKEMTDSRGLSAAEGVIQTPPIPGKQ